MKIVLNTKNIRKRAKAEKLQVDNFQIDEIVKYFLEECFDKLVKGEDLKLPGIGKITANYRAGVSYLNKENPKEYETIKFSFSAFTELKSKANEKLSKAQGKNL